LEQFLAKTIKSVEYSIKSSVTDELLSLKNNIQNLSIFLSPENMQDYFGPLDDAFDGSECMCIRNKTSNTIPDFH
jgi:hypothetical protein